VTTTNNASVRRFMIDSFVILRRTAAMKPFGDRRQVVVAMPRAEQSAHRVTTPARSGKLLGFRWIDVKCACGSHAHAILPERWELSD